MAEIALTAVALCWLRSGMFLFLIAILSFYLALTGYRVLGRKKPGDKPPAFDVGLAAVLALAGAGFIILGLTGDQESKWVRIIFGILTLRLGLMDIYRLFHPSQNKHAWMYSHLARFLGAYIATVTAFSVVNFRFLPYFWRWLWPTALGLVGIAVWRQYYVRKFKNQDHGNV